MSEIPLSRPDITQAEIDAVVDVLRSGRLSIGPAQDEFARLVAQRAGRMYAIPVSSGTAGLHLILKALGVGPGDEVLTTPFSFIASANCALIAGADVRFVDICPTTLNLDPAKVEAAITPRTKAIVGVEVFGQPGHMDELERIANRHEVPLVEDCCEALGGTLHGRPVGSFGRAGVFGFYPNKQVTTGEGGMIVTDDRTLADACESMRNQGRAGRHFRAPGQEANNAGAWLEHERLGYNYRLSEIQAALGVAQMKRLDTLLEKRRRVAQAYFRCLMGQPELILPYVQPGHEDDMSWFVFVVRLTTDFDAEARDRIIAGLRRHEVGSSNYFPCIHLQPFYRKRFGHKVGDFPLAEATSSRTIALPFHGLLREDEIDVVCRTLKLMLQRESLSRP
ncbi:MAG: DegT/DnrJ/EryC1/StrS family aminotransferase [Planctomycetota bacterium]